MHSTIEDSFFRKDFVSSEDVDSSNFIAQVLRIVASVFGNTYVGANDQLLIWIPKMSRSGYVHCQ